MKMSEEMAVRLHRMMWSDMQRELGDCPNSYDRNKYKENWCETHFPGETILFNCFLCDYSNHKGFDNNCDKCPIRWPDRRCSSAIGRSPVKADYRVAPISEILALPAKNEKLASEERDHISTDREELGEVREALANAISVLRLYQSALSIESNLPPNTPVADHISRIREYAFSDGQDAERERIMDKIGEMLNDKPTGTCKDL